MIICHTLNLIFFKTKKTGSTSFEIALSRFCGPDCVITPITPANEEIRRNRGYRGPQNFRDTIWPDGTGSSGKFYNHITAEEARHQIPDQVWRDYQKIAIVRDPFDAAISRYYWEGVERTGLDFGQFIDAHPEYLAESAQIAPFDGPNRIDRHLRYETLAEDVEALGLEGLWEDFAGIRAKGGRRPERGASCEELYTQFPDAAEIVEAQCAAEITRFGYRNPARS